MYDFADCVRKEMEEVSFLLKEAKEKLGRRHPGTLSTKTIKGNNYYYETRHVKGKVKQKYLGTAGDERLGEFILLKVMEDRIRILQEDLEVLRYAGTHYQDYSTDVIINNLGDKYKNGFWEADSLNELEKMNGELPWETSGNYSYINIDTEQKYFERDIITCDGTHVRSKGECILYDLLKAVYIEFEYEPKLCLYNEDYNYIDVHPDFYITCKDGSHIIIEHLGLLDDIDYAHVQQVKLRMYHLNGYDLCHNLIMTSDNSTFGLDSGFISDLINGVILKRAKTTQ